MKLNSELLTTATDHTRRDSSLMASSFEMAGDKEKEDHFACFDDDDNNHDYSITNKSKKPEALPLMHLGESEESSQ
jgi:hypothetical protein